MVGGPWARDLLGISAIDVVKGGGVRLLHNRRWLQTMMGKSGTPRCFLPGVL